MYAGDIPKYGMMLLPNFMKIGTDVPAISRFCLENLRGCNAGITDVRDLRYLR
jgi:hypothetical protein